VGADRSRSRGSPDRQRGRSGLSQEVPIHEAGLAANIVAIVASAAEANHLARVKQIVVEVGQFSGVEPELLRFAFQFVQKGPRLEGAQLEILRPPLALFCKNCQVEYAGSLDDLCCPNCRQAAFEVLRGRELRVKAITGGPDDNEGNHHAG
jgi:hydrogenase nickel incorporation protein HypA/HybF